MAHLADVRSRLSAFPDVRAQLATLREEMQWVAFESPHASIARLWCSYGASADRYLPLSLAPILDRALIREAIAVGWHSAPLPPDAPPHLTDYADRLLLGRLIHAAKLYDEPMWSADERDIQAIGTLAAYALASTRFGATVDLLVAVPSSRGSNSLPEAIARDLAFLTRIRHAPAALRFERELPQIKSVGSYWAAREVLHGSMVADAARVRGRSVLLIDDVCRTGVTLHECARACHRAGAHAVAALVASKAFGFQRLPIPDEHDLDAWVEA